MEEVGREGCEEGGEGGKRWREKEGREGGGEKGEGGGEVDSSQSYQERATQMGLEPESGVDFICHGVGEGEVGEDPMPS